MRRRVLVTVALLAVVTLAPVSFAGAQTRTPDGIVVQIGAGYQTSDRTLTEQNTFTQYLEPATIESRYRWRSGPTVDVAVAVPLRRQLTVGGGVAVMSRPAQIVLSGEIPSPLGFDMNRSAEQRLADARHREVSVRAEIGWSVPLGAWVLTVSGGPALVHVQQDFAGQVSVRETEYPFETVELVAAARSRESGWTVGGTAAGDLSWFVTRRIGLGVSGRFTAANWDVRGVRVRAAGPSVVAGVRLRP
jgi:hypothetical protein